MVHFYEVDIPATYTNMYDAIASVPFQKEADGYHYASSFLERDDHAVNKLKALWETEDRTVLPFPTTEHKEAFKAASKAVWDKLCALVIDEKTMQAWITFRNDTGGVRTYHEYLSQFQEELLTNCLALSVVREYDGDIKNGSELPHTEVPKESKVCTYTDTVLLADYTKIQITDKTKERGQNIVLNHNNPFADISIKEQTFIYGSATGQFEMLELSTSHTVTRMAKDTERTFLALQPGFKIRKQVRINEKTSTDIVFDDTLTTELAQNDNALYVYI